MHIYILCTRVRISKVKQLIYDKKLKSIYNLKYFLNELKLRILFKFSSKLFHVLSDLFLKLLWPELVLKGWNIMFISTTSNIFMDRITLGELVTNISRCHSL